VLTALSLQTRFNCRVFLFLDIRSLITSVYMWALNTVVIGQNINLNVTTLSKIFCLLVGLNERR